MSRNCNGIGPSRWHWTVGRAPIGEVVVPAPTRPSFRNPGSIKTSEYRAGVDALLYQPSPTEHAPFLQRMRDTDPGPLRGRARPWSSLTEDLMVQLGMANRIDAVLHDLHYLSAYLDLYWAHNRGNTERGYAAPHPWLMIPTPGRHADATLLVAMQSMLRWIQSQRTAPSFTTVMTRAADRILILSSLCCLFAQEAAQLITATKLHWILNTAAVYYRAGGDRVADVDYLSPLQQVREGGTEGFSFAVEVAVSLHLANAGIHVTTIPSTDPGAGEMFATSRCDYLLDGQNLAEVKVLMSRSPRAWSLAISRGAQQLRLTTAEHGPVGPTGEPRQRWLILCHLAWKSLLRSQLRTVATIDPGYGHDYDHVFMARADRAQHATVHPLVEVFPDET